MRVLFFYLTMSCHSFTWYSTNVLRSCKMGHKTLHPWQLSSPKEWKIVNGGSYDWLHDFLFSSTRLCISFRCWSKFWNGELASQFAKVALIPCLLTVCKHIWCNVVHVIIIIILFWEMIVVQQFAQQNIQLREKKR